MLSISRSAKMPSNIIFLHLPNFYNGYINEYKTLFEKITSQLEILKDQGYRDIVVPCYSVKDTNYPIDDFTMIYIFALYRFCEKHRNINIYIYSDNKSLNNVYRNTLASIKKNDSFYKKEILGLFEGKTVTKYCYLKGLPAIILSLCPKSRYAKNYLKRLVDTEGKIIARALSIYSPDGYYFKYYPEHIQILPVKGSINLSYSKCEISILKNNIKLTFHPTCFFI